MKSLLDPAVRAEIAARAGRLRSETRPVWGRFSSAQMLRHMSVAMKSGLGEIAVATVPGTAMLRTAVGRWFAIYSPIPWMRGLPTAPEFLPPASVDFDEARGEALAVLERFGSRTGEFQPHPAFGSISRTDWGHLQWRHFDHHLRQFGV